MVRVEGEGPMARPWLSFRSTTAPQAPLFMFLVRRCALIRLYLTLYSRTQLCIAYSCRTNSHLSLLALT